MKKIAYKRFVGQDDAMTLEEAILYAIGLVVIFAGCGALGLILWASQQPIN